MSLLLRSAAPRFGADASDHIRDEEQEEFQVSFWTKEMSLLRNVTAVEVVPGWLFSSKDVLRTHLQMFEKSFLRKIHLSSTQKKVWKDGLLKSLKKQFIDELTWVAADCKSQYNKCKSTCKGDDEKLKQMMIKNGVRVKRAFYMDPDLISKLKAHDRAEEMRDGGGSSLKIPSEPPLPDARAAAALAGDVAAGGGDAGLEDGEIRVEEPIDKDNAREAAAGEVAGEPVDKDNAREAAAGEVAGEQVGEDNAREAVAGEVAGEQVGKDTAEAAAGEVSGEQVGKDTAGPSRSRLASERSPGNANQTAQRARTETASAEKPRLHVAPPPLRPPPPPSENQVAQDRSMLSRIMQNQDKNAYISCEEAAECSDWMIQQVTEIIEMCQSKPHHRRDGPLYLESYFVAMRLMYKVWAFGMHDVHKPCLLIAMKLCSGDSVVSSTSGARFRREVRPQEELDVFIASNYDTLSPSIYNMVATLVSSMGRRQDKDRLLREATAHALVATRVPSVFLMDMCESATACMVASPCFDGSQMSDAVRSFASRDTVVKAVSWLRHTFINTRIDHIDKLCGTSLSRFEISRTADDSKKPPHGEACGPRVVVPAVPLLSASGYALDNRARHGEGGFGQVFGVLHAGKTINLVAKVSKEPVMEASRGLERSVVSEMSIHALLRSYGQCQNIVTCNYVCFEGTGIPHAVILLEKLDPVSRTLLKEITTMVAGHTSIVTLNAQHAKFGRTPTKEESAVSLLRDVACGLSFMHSVGVAHGDLKPENLLIDLASCTLKLTDFGSSHPFVAGANGAVRYESCTADFAAPEATVAPRAVCTFEADVWALGATFFFMLKQERLIEIKNIGRKKRTYAYALLKIMSFMGVPTEDELPGIQSFWMDEYNNDRDMRSFQRPPEFAYDSGRAADEVCTRAGVSAAAHPGGPPTKVFRLFEGMLHMSEKRRWSTDQVLACIDDGAGPSARAAFGARSDLHMEAQRHATACMRSR